MTAEEHIVRAEQLCERLRNASTEIGPPGRQKTIRGADPNEVKKMLSFLMRRRDMAVFKKLVDKLPNSNFAQRSGSTIAYYKNIQWALGGDFYRLDPEDGIRILAWVTRLI
jgi:hypothetical protein